MVGCNCGFPECGTSRRQSYSGIGIFIIPQRKTEEEDIALETLNVVKKYWVLDGEFKRQIESGNVFVCKRHYESEDIEYTSKYIVYI